MTYDDYLNENENEYFRRITNDVKTGSKSINDLFISLGLYSINNDVLLKYVFYLVWKEVKNYDPTHS